MQIEKATSRTLIASLMFLALATHCSADETEDGWTTTQVEGNGGTMMSFDMTLHPRAEAKPALRYRLIPDGFDRIEGNAALYYLKALGFFEQTSARRAVEKFEQEAAEKARLADETDFAPYTWMSTLPEELPKEDMRKFLSLLSFQVDSVREATRRNHFDLNRNIREVEDPIAYLLPEIQSLRQLARYHSMRTRLAIAEKDLDRALKLIGDQIALANHLGNDEFFVSNLVGAAVASIGWTDAIHLLNQENAPNLYWAFATLPRPLIGMNRSSSFERQFLFEQVKCLKEVTEVPRSTEYWRDFLDRFEKQIGLLIEMEMSISTDKPKDEIRAATAVIVASAYPGAREYLTSEVGMDIKQIEALPNVQVVMLAVRRYYEHSRDELFKWLHVPYASANQSNRMATAQQKLKRDEEKYGWITKPSSVLLPMLPQLRAAKLRIQQQIAMAQIIESIRDHAATNDSKLPGSLAELRLPAPHDPVVGAAFAYAVDGDSALLTSSPANQPNPIQYRFRLRIAK